MSTSESGPGPPPYVGEREIAAFGYGRAVDALQDALCRGLDTSADPPRTELTLRHSARLLQMPSAADHDVGVKVISVAPRNAAAGLPLVQGLFLLFDHETLAPVALLDGAALTTLRTPAVSLAAVRPALQRLKERYALVVFGLGPQGVGHLDALRDLADHDPRVPAPAHATFVTRSPAGSRLPRRNGMTVHAAASGTSAAEEALRQADVVVGASGASDPLFDSRLLSEDVIVMSVGSHQAHLSEVDTALCRRAVVVVEDEANAQTDNGAVVAAIEAGALTPADLVPMAAVATGAADRQLAVGTVLFTGSGMAWQDLVVARAIAGR